MKKCFCAFARCPSLVLHLLYLGTQILLKISRSVVAEIRVCARALEILVLVFWCGSRFEDCFCVVVRDWNGVCVVSSCVCIVTVECGYRNDGEAGWTDSGVGCLFLESLVLRWRCEISSFSIGGC